MQNPTQKIRGKLVKTIERKFYKEEFTAIIKEQIKHHPELQDSSMYLSCIQELYPRNEAHQNNIKGKDFEYLFTKDIIFYQRPLKSKKSTISGCQYEIRTFKKKVKENDTNIEKEIRVKKSLKAISKSHPLFQEFRLWQFLKNFKIYKVEGKGDINITSKLLKTEEDWIGLFDFLSIRKEIEQHQIIKYFSDKKLIPKQKKDNSEYRWNYVEDKKYPCNETKAQFTSRLKKTKNIDIASFLTSKTEHKLWHIIYSVKDKIEFEKALHTFAKTQQIDEDSFVENFKRFPPFKSDYGAYSEKAIKKLLPLMRRGKYWNENQIPNDVKERMTAIIERVKNIKVERVHKDFENELIRLSDDDIPKKLLKSFIDFKDKNPLQGLNTYQACYAVYNRYSEASSITQWKHPKDITKYLYEFKQHSLRNPIVEQVVTETLRTVRDIWEYYGEGKEDFFDEIHIELGREMKNDKKKRESISKQNTINENTNHRIKEILKELMNEGVAEVKPYSPSQQDILKIYEEGVYQNDNNINDDIEKIRKKNVPTKAEMGKYKLWLEQGYISPYTGKTIGLSSLFTHKYEIEHIIPQSRYFDNSMSNKIICESEVNGDKGNMTAYEYIVKKGGSIVDGFPILKLDEYEGHCNQYFKNNRSKLKKLLSEDIPEGFINRQLNDSRYISKFIKGLLSNLVREDNEQEATSKHIVPVTGSITSKLKQDWGLNDKWNELIAPRFKRLNEMTNSNDFGYEDQQLIDGKKTGKKFFRTQVPDAISKGFNKKRIDHRHHALDALVIACCTKKHTNYLGALNAENKNFGLRDSLLTKSKEGDYTKHFLHPWENFTIDAKTVLEKTIISFKQNVRVINKTNNKTWQWTQQKDGNFKKELVKQTKGDNWAIRKPMHKETVSGKLDIPVPKGKIATASRVSLSEIKTQKLLEKITDKSIQKILESHLQHYLNKDGKKQFDLAFNADGVEELNKNIQDLNNGKNHQPIYKVRLYEVGSRFRVGCSGNKKDKYVEAAKGTNLFFAIYWDKEKKKRVYDTIPLNEVIEHQKWRATIKNKEERNNIPIIPTSNTKGEFMFFLSPNDLVYVPMDEEIENTNLVDFDNLSKEQVSRVMTVNDFSGVTCYFSPNSFAKAISPKEIDTSFDSKTAKYEGMSIKDRCWKLKVDRLGNIKMFCKNNMYK